MQIYFTPFVFIPTKLPLNSISQSSLKQEDCAINTLTYLQFL